MSDVNLFEKFEERFFQLDGRCTVKGDSCWLLLEEDKGFGLKAIWLLTKAGASRSTVFNGQDRGDTLFFPW